MTYTREAYFYNGDGLKIFPSERTIHVIIRRWISAIFAWFSLISELLSHHQHLHRDDQRFTADVVLRSISTTSHPGHWIVRVRIRMIDNVLSYCQSVLMISFETWRHVDDVTCKLVRFIFLPLRSIRRYVQIDQGEIVLHTSRHLHDRLVALPVWHKSFDKVIVNESRRSSFLDNWIVHIIKSDLDTPRLLIIMSSILTKVMIRTTWNITFPYRSCQ